MVKMNSKYNNRDFAESLIGKRKRFEMSCLSVILEGVVERISTHGDELIYVIRMDPGYLKYVGANSPNLIISECE